jgi:hypothetical protein
MDDYAFARMAWGRSRWTTPRALVPVTESGQITSDLNAAPIPPRRASPQPGEGAGGERLTGGIIMRTW